MIYKRFKLTQCVKSSFHIIIPVLLASSLVFASGNGGGGGGGGGGGDGGYTHTQRNYEKGKKVFFEKIVCNVCPYADLELENDAMKSVWPDLKRDLKKKGEIGMNLSRKHRKAVKKFIKKRFDL